MINKIWAEQLDKILTTGIECAPRGKKILEILGAQVKFNMNDPIVTVASRGQNFKFAFGEASWIVGGSNKVSDITKFMKSYSNFSDDSLTLNGAYGPKFVEQMSWVAKTLAEDQDSRQAVMSFWRERPGPSKDIPCTLTQQYFIRNGRLHVVATMRSNDLAWGFCYDTFTFTMMARAIQIILRSVHGINVTLGHMTLNQGSAHIYEPFWEKSKAWIKDERIDPKWREISGRLASEKNSGGFTHEQTIFLPHVHEGLTYELLLESLEAAAELSS